MKFRVFGDVNYLAALLGALAYWLLGALWYSPALFGKKWMALSGRSPQDIGSPVVVYVGTFVLHFVSAVGVALIALESGVANLNDAVQLGLGAGIAFMAVAIIVTHLYEGRPKALTAITAGYHVVGLTVASVVIWLFD
ncbi:MAG: DUF1761 domain-containing protein [Actinobacteria bacterium]|nr:DUF1761 domain-containing protein [Actinomycetota bacterium]